MAKRFSEYPIGKLVLRCIEESGLTAGNFVLAIGYRNPAKGIRALDSLLSWGSTSSYFFELLNKSQYAPSADEFQAAEAETKEILKEENRLYRIKREAEERAAFRPYVQGVPELSLPTSITCYAFSGGASRFTIQLPAEFPAWSKEEQLAYLKERIVTFHASCNGRTFHRGAILAYRLFHTYGEPAIAFSVEGEPRGLDQHPPEGDSFVRIGNKALTGEQVTRVFGLAERA